MAVNKAGNLLPPVSTQAEIDEWYNSLVDLNRSIDAHNMQCVMKIRAQYESVQQKCLAEAQLCKRSFEELAEHNEQNCRDLYSYCQGAIALWDIHQLKLSQQEGEFRKELDECRWKQDKSIQNLEGKTDTTFSGQVEVSEAENQAEQQTESIVQENEEEQKADSCQQQKQGTNIPENEEASVQEREEREEQKDGKSVFQESDESKDVEQGMSSSQDMFNNGKVEISELAVETFSTSSGNTYTVLRAEESGKPDVLETCLTNYDEKEPFPMYLERGLIRGTVFEELKKRLVGNCFLFPFRISFINHRIRLCFFEHLEKWFAESLSNSWATVDTWKEELSSELQQHLLWCEQMQENIETNICSVRAGTYFFTLITVSELLLHKEHLECHCNEVGEALKKERAKFLRFCRQQKASIQNLDSRIRDRESEFLRAPVAASWRKKNKELQTNECVSYFWVLKATEVINKAEARLRGFIANRTFMEKIQRLLANIRLQIKSEVANSNMQAAALKSSLEKLHAFAHPTADRKVSSKQMKQCYQQFQVMSYGTVSISEVSSLCSKCHLYYCIFQALTSEELYDFIKVVLKELKARSQYLDCLLASTTRPHDKVG
ncbi:UNVERIFIED_CONTAM: hypothetical protein H355_006733 [Colinus virginianus]|nr:hypothetical protein H355_006733 [Colinus virginianus]